MLWTTIRFPSRTRVAFDIPQVQIALRRLVDHRYRRVAELHVDPICRIIRSAAARFLSRGGGKMKSASSRLPSARRSTAHRALPRSSIEARLDLPQEQPAHADVEPNLLRLQPGIVRVLWAIRTRVQSARLRPATAPSVRKGDRPAAAGFKRRRPRASWPTPWGHQNHPDPEERRNEGHTGQSECIPSNAVAKSWESFPSLASGEATNPDPSEASSPSRRNGASGDNNPTTGTRQAQSGESEAPSATTQPVLSVGWVQPTNE